MKKIYFTITGTNYRYGQDFLEPGMKVKLEKEPDNPYDAEAIKVMMKGCRPSGDRFRLLKRNAVFKVCCFRGGVVDHCDPRVQLSLIIVMISYWILQIKETIFKI